MLTIAALIAVCALVDGLMTYRRIKKYGIGAELNPIAQLCMQEFGIGRGLAIALVPFNVGILSILISLGFRDGLLVLLGARLCFLALGLYSLKLEKMIDNKLGGGED